MKNPEFLTREQLVEIVQVIQEIMYLDPHSGKFDCDREWSSTDVCQDIALLLDQFELLPSSDGDDLAPLDTKRQSKLAESKSD